MSTSDQAPVAWMVEGYQGALKRLTTVAATRTQRLSTYIPLFEALNWAASIDLFFREKGDAVESDLLTGVRFARHRVHHQWAKALARATVLEYHVSLWPRARRGSSARHLASGGTGSKQINYPLGRSGSPLSGVARGSTSPNLRGEQLMRLWRRSARFSRRCASGPSLADRHVAVGTNLICDHEVRGRLLPSHERPAQAGFSTEEATLTRPETPAVTTVQEAIEVLIASRVDEGGIPTQPA